MLEGAFLAQEEYDNNKNQWKGRTQEMESHFLSTYDTLPDTSEHSSSSGSSGSGSSDAGGIILILTMLGLAYLCILVFSAFR